MTLTTRAPAARPAPGRRTGFTLIELLVVLAIIAIMFTIIGVSLQKVAQGRRNNTTKEAMYKLQQSLDTDYGHVVKKCATDQQKREIPQAVVDYAEGEPNRTLAVWIALNLRRQFPDNFTDAVTPAYITQNTSTGALAGTLALRTTMPLPANEVAIYSLQPLEVFKEFQVSLGNVGNPPLPNYAPNLTGTVNTVAPNTRDDESAALLYYILAKKSVTGGGAMTSSADDLSQSMQRKIPFAGLNGGAARELTTFADAWSGSIGFRRWYGHLSTDLYGPEVQLPPYLDSKVNTATNNNKDPIDPRNVVYGWTTNGTANAAKQLQMAELGFKGLNRLTTVYSLGQSPLDPKDDIFGFRQRKFGN